MTITRALNELKLLDAKIEKKIESTRFVDVKTNNSKVVGIGKEPLETYPGDVKSNLQSIKDLIKRKKEIKSKIQKSNIDTLVDVAGTTMTRADAIDRKRSIEAEKSLLEKLKEDFKQAQYVVNTKNDQLEEKIERIVTSLVSADRKDPDLMNSAKMLAESTRKNEEFTLVDPLGIDKLIKEMEMDILEFESNVDFVLSESNSITQIEVED